MLLGQKSISSLRIRQIKALFLIKEHKKYFLTFFFYLFSLFFLKEIFSIKSRIVSFIDKFMLFNCKKKERLDLMNP